MGRALFGGWEGEGGDSVREMMWDGSGVEGGREGAGWVGWRGWWML